MKRMNTDNPTESRMYVPLFAMGMNFRLDGFIRVYPFHPFYPCSKGLMLS
jgi:hypothetical protein